MIIRLVYAATMLAVMGAGIAAGHHPAPAPCIYIGHEIETDRK